MSIASTLVEALQSWLQANTQGTRVEDRPMRDLRNLIQQFETLTEPLPQAVSWHCVLYGAKGPQQDGTLLEMLLDCGNFQVAQGSPQREKDVQHYDALVKLGTILLKKGVPLTPRLVEIAVDLRQNKLDFERKVQACEAWGIQPGFAFDGQKAASLCARGGQWHGYVAQASKKSTSEVVWDWLVSLGALQDAERWTHCEQMRHPGVCALMDRDWKGFGRVIKSGVALDWADPVSGATLWHFVCIGGTAMIKHCLPVLLASPKAIALVQSPTRAPETFGEKAWTVAVGSTPLHCAVSQLNLGATQALLGLGVSVNARDNKGRTALHLLGNRWSLKAQTKTEPIVRALLAGGADARLEDAKGQTVVQAMVAKAPLGALEVLLTQHAQDVGGEAPQQKKALKTLSARTEEKARALGEQAALRVLMSVGSPQSPYRGATTSSPDIGSTAALTTESDLVSPGAENSAGAGAQPSSEGAPVSRRGRRL